MNILYTNKFVLSRLVGEFKILYLHAFDKKYRYHVRIEIIWRYHVRDEIFKTTKIFILKIIANVRFCPLMVIADGGACAWLFIETRATRAYQAHAPKKQAKRTEEELRPSKAGRATFFFGASFFETIARNRR